MCVSIYTYIVIKIEWAKYTNTQKTHHKQDLPNEKFTPENVDFIPNNAEFTILTTTNEE